MERETERRQHRQNNEMWGQKLPMRKKMEERVQHLALRHCSKRQAVAASEKIEGKRQISGSDLSSTILENGLHTFSTSRTFSCSHSMI